MNVRIQTYPPHYAAWHYPWWRRRWTWTVHATRGGVVIDTRAGRCWTRLGAEIARDRAAARLRRTHGGGA